MNHDRAKQFPLDWPIAQPRARHRTDSRFKMNASVAIGELAAELRRFRANKATLSSNIPLRSNGLPYADDGVFGDPGVALYFERGGKPFVIACDSYRRPWENIRAVAIAMESLRAIERHGAGQIADQAISGFAQLPAHVAQESWWVVLGVESTAATDQINAAHQRLALEAHPDLVGEASTDRMMRINAARDRAYRDLGVTS